MKIHYLLLGIVLMISGLEVTAQVSFVCSDGDLDYYQFAPVDGIDFTIVPQNQDAIEHFVPTEATTIAVAGETDQVLVWENAVNSYDVWQTDTICPTNEKEVSQLEHDMIVWVHEAAQRGIFDGVFGRGGE